MNTEIILIAIGSLILVSLLVLIIVLIKRKPNKSANNQSAQQSFTLDDEDDGSSRYNRTFVLLQKEEKEKKQPVRSKEGTVSMDPNESSNYNYRNEAPVNTGGGRRSNEERTGVLFAPTNPPQEYAPPARRYNNSAYSDHTELLAEDQADTAYLEFYQDGMVNRMPLDRPSILLGRLRGEVDYVINNSKVSKVHAEIICRGGCYFIKDYNSGNGTYINGSGKRIPSNVEHRIHNNDRISLANSDFVLKC